MIQTLRKAIDGKQARTDQNNFNLQQQKLAETQAEKRERRFAFDKTVTEVISLLGSLDHKYDISRDHNISPETVLKRKELKNSYSAEYNRLVLLMDRILQYTDVQFLGKDTMLNNHLESQVRIENKKSAFEEKLCLDIERFDLTEQKLKLATQTKVDIGKFSGSLEKGLDFYTFKTKFLKAYSNHPKNLLVEWLVNNHLEGKAKDCV